MKVLAIDDDRMIGLLLETLLQTHPEHTLFVAQSFAEALAHFTKERPDVILVDYHLPDATGSEVIKKLRGELEYDGVILYFSATAPAKYLPKGCNGILDKPINPMTFVDDLERRARGG